jgi:hypothetical protein
MSSRPEFSWNTVNALPDSEPLFFTGEMVSKYLSSFVYEHRLTIWIDFL